MIIGRVDGNGGMLEAGTCRGDIYIYIYIYVQIVTGQSKKRGKKNNDFTLKLMSRAGKKRRRKTPQLNCLFPSLKSQLHWIILPVTYFSNNSLLTPSVTVMSNNSWWSLIKTEVFFPFFFGPTGTSIFTHCQNTCVCGKLRNKYILGKSYLIYFLSRTELRL